MTRNALLATIGFMLALALGVAYLVWLDAGCEVQGAMTMHGKVCVFEN